MKTYDGVALLSGGLDSILAIKLITDQGLSVLGLHFVSPFYGKPDDIIFWGRWLGIDVEMVDGGPDMAALVAGEPPHGFGSVLNPCVDCKIMMMKKAREYMQKHEAKFIISGEVLGQRPMSQRRDTLNVISRDGDVRDFLLRPLCALHMAPTQAETSGLVDRERLKGFSGRGRKDQLALAKEMALPRVPSPAGGCMLTEKENARRYWPLVEAARRGERVTDADFRLANTGRQFRLDNAWLAIGRNQDDNAIFESLARPGDLLLKTAGFSGPLALLRTAKGQSPKPVLSEAAALVASYSPKACRAYEEGKEIQVRVHTVEENTPDSRPAARSALPAIPVIPRRESAFAEPMWDAVRDGLAAMRKPALRENHI